MRRSQLAMVIALFALTLACNRLESAGVNAHRPPSATDRHQVVPFKPLTEPVGPEIVHAYADWLRDERTHSSLSALYRRSGYYIAAAIVDGRTPALPEGGQWLCRGDEFREEINSSVEAIKDSRGQWRMSEAIGLANTALRDFPDSCRIVVELSSAELSTVLEGTPVTPERQEAAFRILVTGATEAVFVPADQVSGGQTLLDVARYLRTIKRRDSARAAAELGIAIARHDRTTTNSNVLRGGLMGVEAQIERFLKKL